MSEVLENDDAARTRVGQLVLEFARCVQRIDVNGDQPGPEYASERHGVLQQVGEHDRDAFAAREAKILLQVAGELHRQLVNLTVGQRRPHVGVGGAFGPGIERMLENFAHAAEGRVR